MSSSKKQLRGSEIKDHITTTNNNSTSPPRNKRIEEEPPRSQSCSPASQESQDAIEKTDEENGDQQNTIGDGMFSDSVWLSKHYNHSKRKVDPNIPSRRWGHTAIVYEKFMYVFGGCGVESDASSDVFRLDCKSYEWEKLEIASTEQPDSRDSHSATLINNKIWIFGGSNTHTLFNDLWTLDLQTNCWTNLTQGFKGEMPCPREGHCAVALLDRYLIIIGGFSPEHSQIFQDVTLLDTQNKTSKCIGSIRMSLRHSQTACVVDENIFLFGGHSNEGECLNDMHRLRIDNIRKSPSLNVEEIKYLSDESVYPTGRSNHCCVSYQNRYLLLMGGESQGGTFEALGDVWVYDTRMNYWNQIISSTNNGLNGRFSFSGCIYKEKLLVFGGIHSQNCLLNTLQILQLKDYHKQSLQENIQLCPLCQTVFSANTSTTPASHSAKNSASKKGVIQSDSTPSSSLQNNQQLILPFSNNSSSNYQFLSCQFLKDLASMIASPFQAISILFDYLLTLSDVAAIQIKDSNSPQKMKLVIQQKTAGLNQQDFSIIMTSFAEARTLYFDPTNKDRESYFKANQKMIDLLQFAYSVKVASCRLGDTLLMESRDQSILSVGLIRFGTQDNTNNMLQVIFYSFDESKGKYLTENGESSKNQINSLISQDMLELSKEESVQGLSFVITQLNLLHHHHDTSSQKVQAEIIYDTTLEDIILNTSATSIDQQALSLISNTIDCSFKSFASFYYLVPPANKQLFLNSQPVLFKSYSQSLSQPGYKPIIIDSSINQSQSASSFGQLDLFSSNSSESLLSSSGCLAYYHNRLAFRFVVQPAIGLPSILRLKHRILQYKPLYSIQGTLDLNHSLKINILQNSIEDPFLQETFLIRMNGFIKQIQAFSKKESTQVESPSLRKQIKLNEPREQPE